MQSPPKEITEQSAPPWELKNIIELMQDKIKELSDKVKRLESHEDEVWKVVNVHTAELRDGRAILREAGLTGDVKVLGRIRETGT